MSDQNIHVDDADDITINPTEEPAPADPTPAPNPAQSPHPDTEPDPDTGGDDDNPQPDTADTGAAEFAPSAEG